MRAISLVALVAALAFAVAPALGQKGGNGRGNGNGGSNYAATGGTTLNESDPALGSTVTFSTSYPNNVNNPSIDVVCYQNGALVYSEGGTADHAFLLGEASSDWLRAGELRGASLGPDLEREQPAGMGRTRLSASCS